MTPEQVLQKIYELAILKPDHSVIHDEDIKQRVDYICRCMANRAGVRLLMACLLGKLINPAVDPRKPYTEIGSQDCFSGRTYDEKYLTYFISKHRLPCNPTTAFLTPGLRNIDKALTTNLQIVGRPREIYIATLQLLDDVYQSKIDAETLFIEVVRVLLNIRDEKLGRITSLLKSLEKGEGALPLSSEAILNLIQQHLACKNSSRLPVLIIAAAYKAVGDLLGETTLPLNAHNAADLQTGALGDLEICIEGDDKVVTAYEMKMKRVTIDDINLAITKIAKAQERINNYIFVTTERIDPEVTDYTIKLYEELAGTEIAILDCLGFLKHFLHFFHRLRIKYLDAYQELVLTEPDSSVSQVLKEAFLVLRQAAESGE